MHCHNGDQTFYVIEGECTMHFPDGGKAVMNLEWLQPSPGDLSTIWKTAATGPMIMMGNRSGPSEAIQHVNYELENDIKKLSNEELERANIPYLAMQARR